MKIQPYSLKKNIYITYAYPFTSQALALIFALGIQTSIFTSFT